MEQTLDPTEVLETTEPACSAARLGEVVVQRETGLHRDDGILAPRQGGRKFDKALADATSSLQQENLVVK
jgi:hypothetical protein